MVLHTDCSLGYRMVHFGSSGGRQAARLSSLVIASVTTFHKVGGVAVLDPSESNPSESASKNEESFLQSNVESAEPSSDELLSNGLPVIVLAAVMIAVSVIALLLAVTLRHHIHPSLTVISSYLKSTGSSMLSSLSVGQSNAGRRRAHRRRLRLPGVTPTFARPVVDRCCGSAPDSAVESPFDGDSSSSESGGPWAPRLLELLARQQERSKRQQRTTRTSKLAEVTAKSGTDALESTATSVGSEDFFACSTPSSGFQTPLELLPTDCEDGSCYGTDSPRLAYFSRKLVLLPDD